jgi:transcription initiation factor TFIIB
MDGLTEQLDTRIGHRDGGSGAARDLQRTLGRVGGTSHRTILDAFEDIQRKCDSIHLNRQVSETAKQLFKRVEMEKILRGKKTDAIVAACIYIACKIASVPRTFPEICALTKVSKKLIGQSYKEISNAFGLHKQFQANAAGEGGSGVTPTNAVDLVSRFSNHLALDRPTIGCIRDVAERIRDEGLLAGRSPITIAAACIYFATTLLGQSVSAKSISNAAGVSDVTIKSSYKGLVDSKSRILTVSQCSQVCGVDEAHMLARQPGILEKHKLIDVANLSSA